MNDIEKLLEACKSIATPNSYNGDCIDKLCRILNIGITALEKINNPYEDKHRVVNELIIADMGLKHFTECTAKFALDEMGNIAREEK